MKLKHFNILAIFTLALSSISAQETPNSNLNPPEKIKKVDVCEVSILGGFVAQSNPFASIADYTKLAPNSKILQTDLSAYSKSSAFGGNANGMFSVLMGMRFGKKDGSAYRNNPILRLGVTYMNSASLSTGYYQTTRKPYDTLLSYQSGAETYIDSLTTRNINISYSSQQVRLDFSLIYRTDGKARWNFYSGIGFNAGVSLNAYTNVNYYTNASLSSSESNSNSPYYSPFGYGNYGGFSYFLDGTNQTETFKNKNNTAFSAYIPLGIDFRMGKKRDFWKRTHLFCEFRPGINSITIPELGTYTSAFFQGNLGLKINWENM